MHNFTLEDLILYLYKETPQLQTAQIAAALKTDWILRDKFEVIISNQENLETLKMEPRQQTIDNILNYAEKTVAEFSPI